MPVQTQLQMRRDTAANWTSTNPTLASGEWGLETDTRLMKIGDGATAWNSLGYQLNSLLDEELATDPNGAYFDGTGLRLYGVTGNGATSPDSAALDITGDIDIRVKLALDDWTPSTNTELVAKWGSGALTNSYYLRVQTNGTLRLVNFTDAAGTNVSRVSTVATGITDGATKWVRATLDVDNGAGGNDAKFYTSDDGTNWTQLGTTVTTAGTTSIFAGTNPLAIGSVSDIFTNPAKGTIYRAQVLNGIGGTTAFDANFETVPADSFAFTESSANAATVTLTTTRYSFGIPGATLTGTLTTGIGGNNTTYMPFSVRNKPITIKHVAFEVTTAPTSNSTNRIGIYKADIDNQPTGNIIYESGAITVSSAAAAIYRLRVTPFVLFPGNYVIALNQSVTMTYRALRGTGSTASSALGANLVVRFLIAATLSGAALPTTGTKWNSRAGDNSGFYNPVLLGWS